VEGGEEGLKKVGRREDREEGEGGDKPGEKEGEEGREVGKEMVLVKGKGVGRVLCGGDGWRCVSKS